MTITNAVFATCVICQVREVAYDGNMACGGCYARLKGDLATVADAYDQLAAAMSALAPGWRTGAIHGTEEPKLPFDPDLHDLRQRIIGTLYDWARMIGEEHTPPLAGPADASLETTTRWLRARLPWCSTRPWVDELARELRELRREAGAKVRLQAAYVSLPTPCSGCGRLTLVEYTGDDAVTCRNRECGGLYDWPAYAALVQAWCDRVTMEARRRRTLEREPTDDDRRLVAALDPNDPDDPAGTWLTTEQAAEAAHVEDGIIRSWANRGKLKAELVDDVPYYLLADVLNVEAGTRRGRRELTLLGEAFAYLRQREQLTA